MREVTTFILSWLAVTAIFFIALFFDSLSLSFIEAKAAAIFLILVGFVSGAYFLIIGVPTLYFLFKKKTVSRATFIIAGVLASIPMLIFCIYSEEVEWVIATIAAGFVAGGIFALRLPNQHRT